MSAVAAFLPVLTYPPLILTHPQGMLNAVSARVSALTASASKLYADWEPYVTGVTDYAWFVGSAGLLLSLPILIELQRETTVMVMQKQVGP